MFAFKTVLIFYVTDSKCWKDSLKILVNIDVTASHSCCRLVSHDVNLPFHTG